MDVRRARRRAAIAVGTGVVVLAVLGYAVFELTGNVNRAASPARASAVQATAPAPVVPASSPIASVAPVVPTASAVPASTKAAASASPTASVTPRPQEVALSAVNAAAFGPSGTVDGDNPQLAGNVLADPSAGWMSDWYTTDLFGQLKSGTGLLLDMGHTVTIANISVDLGTASGTSVELRAGAQPDASALPTLTSAANAGEQVSFTLTKPIMARYVLLWFTKLPPVGNGTYQAAVHRVTIEGQP